jgi:hypothetical protein
MFGWVRRSAAAMTATNRCRNAMSLAYRSETTVIATGCIVLWSVPR